MVYSADVGRKIIEFIKWYTVFTKRYWINGVNFIDKSRSFLTCSSVQLSLFTTYLGAVQPCSLYNRSIGNIHFTSIKETWNRPIFYKIANYILNDSKNCSTCVIYNYCTQCPSIALSEIGNSRDCSSICKKQH